MQTQDVQQEKIKLHDPSTVNELIFSVVTQAVLDLNSVHDYASQFPNEFAQLIKNRDNKRYILRLLYFFNEDNLWGQQVLSYCGLEDLPWEIESKIEKLNEFFSEKDLTNINYIV